MATLFSCEIQERAIVYLLLRCLVPPAQQREEFTILKST